MSVFDSTIEFLPKPTTYNFQDLTGQTFGRLTVLGYVGKRNNRSLWQCQCQCTVQMAVSADNLRRNITRSCGCWRRDKAKAMQTVHGEWGDGKSSTEYKSFHCAKGRCNNPKNAAYKDYGGRGIEFRFESFEQFLTEIGRKPTLKHSLDRINNDGHYEKGNVRWATPKQQRRNTRSTRHITINGVTKCMSDWAKEYGIDHRTVWQRVHIGYCDVCAITLPLYSAKCHHKST